VGRMVTRARGLVARRGLSRRVTLHPAPELPEDWRRDGIGLAQSGSPDEELGRTVQVLSSMPASALARELDVSPQEVIEAAEPFGATPLIEAWCRNAAWEERDTLLPLLWDIWWTKPLQRRIAGDTLVMLAQPMPHDVLRQRVLKLLSDPPEGTELSIMLVLNEVSRPWPGDISRSALELLRRWLDRTLRKDRNAGDWPRLIRPLATYAAPETIEETLELLADIERAKVLPAWNQEIGQCTPVLRLRRRFWDAVATAVLENEMTGGRANDSGRG